MPPSATSTPPPPPDIHVGSEPRSGTRYQLLAQALLGDVRAGRYAVGELLPSEELLRERFGVSRHTVRQALRELRTRGVITSRAGIGTTVKGTGDGPRILHTSSSLDDPLNFSRTTRLRLLRGAEVVAHGATAALLRCRDGQAWHLTELLRVDSDGSALAYLEVYLRPEMGSVVNSIDGSDRPVFALLEARYGVRVAEIQQEIASVRLKPAVRKLLHEPQQHGLRIVRHYMDATDQLLELSIGIYRSTSFSFRNTLRFDASRDPLA